MEHEHKQEHQVPYSPGFQEQLDKPSIMRNISNEELS